MLKNPGGGGLKTPPPPINSPPNYIEILFTILKSIVRPKVEFGMNGYFRFK